MKRILSLFTIFSVIIFSCNGQTKEKDKSPIPYVQHEIMPAFPGGDREMMKFIGNNLKHPNIDTCIQGRVVIRFIVTTTGKLDDIKVLKGLHPVYDKEAIRVVEAMPSFSIGKVDGKSVPVYFTLPIIFRPKGANPPETYPRAVYTVLDTMPEFPNGIDEMKKFINHQIMDRLPLNEEHRPSGRVVARFIVNKKGYIEGIKLLKTLSHIQDSIAIDIVKAMPRWNPGVKNGEVVDCYYTIPIPFRHH